MAYTGYTVRHLLVFDGTCCIGVIHLADEDSCKRFVDWWNGKSTFTPDRRPRGAAPQEIKGSSSDEERLQALEAFGINITAVPEDLSKVSFRDTTHRYDTIDVWFNSRRAKRLEALARKQIQGEFTPEFLKTINGLTPEERLEFLKMLSK